MKKNLAKKIVSITIVALVLAMVIVTIVLALVPKRMANPIADGYGTITVYQGNKAAQYNYIPTATTDSQREYNEIYTKIEELHEDSLKENYLSAIFQGTGKFEISVVKANVSNVITSIAQGEGNAIVFTYLQDDKQVLKINGEVYEDESAFSTVTYDMIVMPLNTSESFEECTIYLADRSTNKSAYRVKFLAHQGELNDYIDSLTFSIV